jgi:hypothetical protein
MEFLCPNHRQHFADLPLQERKELWLFWMENAYACTEQQKWKDVISLSGSAFDLACLHGTTDGSCMHIELTLAAILVSRVLAERGDRKGPDRVIFRALERLHAVDRPASCDGCCSPEECTRALLDRSSQADFFMDYLNWPALPFGPRTPAVLSRTIH